MAFREADMGESELTAQEGLTAMRAAFGADKVAIIEGHVDPIIDRYRVSDGGKVVLVYLACKIAAMNETGEL